MYVSVYVRPACNILLPGRCTFGQICFPILNGGNGGRCLWETFQPWVISASIRFEIIQNPSDGVLMARIMNLTQDNLVLSPETMVGHVIQEKEKKFAYQEAQLGEPSLMKKTISLFDASLWDKSAENLSVGEYLEIDQFPLTIHIVRIA